MTSIITGSNAHLLSTELSTYLSGQYVEIKVLPLSFREFLDFHGYTITDSLLLRNLMMSLADNIGNSVSATSIGNTLISEGLLTEGNRKAKPATHTIQAYMEALKESYGNTAQLRLRVSAVFLPHFRSSENGKYIQYSSIFGTLNWNKNPA